MINNFLKIFSDALFTGKHKLLLLLVLIFTSFLTTLDKDSVLLFLESIGFFYSQIFFFIKTYVESFYYLISVYLLFEFFVSILVVVAHYRNQAYYEVFNNILIKLVDYFLYILLLIQIAHNINISEYDIFSFVIIYLQNDRNTKSVIHLFIISLNLFSYIMSVFSFILGRND